MKVRNSLIAALCALALSPAARAWNRGEATTFARLPSGTGQPEGITVDRQGNVYVTQFDPFGDFGGQGKLVVFDHSGKLVRVVTVAGASPALIGLDFHPTTHALLVLDLGHSQVLNVNPVTGAATVFMQADPGSGLNALTFDAAGNVYVSDSFEGVIWKTGPTGGAATKWAQDELLKPHGNPPFGANGVAFNHDDSHKALFVANTGDDKIIRIPVLAGGAAGKAEEFTNSINGADGLIIDDDDRIWVCANQSDEIVIVEVVHTAVTPATPSGIEGKVIAKLGDFDGLSRGEPRGFLFPASLVFSGNSLLVTNLALDTTRFGFTTVDTPWTQQVKTWTVARVPRRIPPVQGDGD
jgi:sugar lactone lactonase YvrE